MENGLFLPSLAFPTWRNEPSAAILRKSDSRLIKFDSIPEFARHLFVRLIECFAIVRISATPNRGAVSLSYFHKPIRVR